VIIWQAVTQRIDFAIQNRGASARWEQAVSFCELLISPIDRASDTTGPSNRIGLLIIFPTNAIIEIYQFRAAAGMSSSRAAAFVVTSACTPIYQRIAASAPAVIRCSFHAPRSWNSRISAAMTMSLADNLLQKQQEQREQGRCGNPALHSGDVEMDRGLGGKACQQVMRFSKSAAHDGSMTASHRAGVTAYG
jgi:hypothetical protein